MVGPNDHDPEVKKSPTPEGKKDQGTKKEEETFSRSSEENPPGRKYNFKPAPLLHFHSAADISGRTLQTLRFSQTFACGSLRTGKSARRHRNFLPAGLFKDKMREWIWKH
jgi:hypothetical protein